MLHTRPKGLSLLEILITLALLLTVIMVMAMVYPSGYRLNLSSKNVTTALNLAQGVMEEIHSMPFQGSPGVDVEDLYLWGSAFSWTPDLNIPAPFFLSRSENKPGVTVTQVAASPGLDIPLYAITVTIGWKESMNGHEFTKYVSLRSLRTSNEYR